MNLKNIPGSYLCSIKREFSSFQMETLKSEESKYIQEQKSTFWVFNWSIFGPGRNLNLISI